MGFSPFISYNIFYMNILTRYYGFKILVWLLLFFPAYYFINDYRSYYFSEALYFKGVPTVGRVESKIREISALGVLYSVSYITESGQKLTKAFNLGKSYEYQKGAAVDMVYFAEAPQFAEPMFSFKYYKLLRAETYNMSILKFFLIITGLGYYYCRKYVIN